MGASKRESCIDEVNHDTIVPTNKSVTICSIAGVVRYGCRRRVPSR